MKIWLRRLLIACLVTFVIAYPIYTFSTSYGVIVVNGISKKEAEIIGRKYISEYGTIASKYDGAVDGGGKWVVSGHLGDSATTFKPNFLTIDKETGEVDSDHGPSYKDIKLLWGKGVGLSSELPELKGPYVATLYKKGRAESVGGVRLSPDAEELFFKWQNDNRRGWLPSFLPIGYAYNRVISGDNFTLNVFGSGATLSIRFEGRKVMDQFSKSLTHQESMLFDKIFDL
jgi:hypothetical protein